MTRHHTDVDTADLVMKSCDPDHSGRVSLAEFTKGVSNCFYKCARLVCVRRRRCTQLMPTLLIKIWQFSSTTNDTCFPCPFSLYFVPCPFCFGLRLSFLIDISIHRSVFICFWLAMIHHANLLNPAFQTQLELRRVLGGPAFWERETKRLTEFCKAEEVNIDEALHWSDVL